MKKIFQLLILHYYTINSYCEEVFEKIFRLLIRHFYTFRLHRKIQATHVNTMPLLRNLTVKLKTKLTSPPSSQPSSPVGFEVVGRDRRSVTTTPVQQKRMDSFLSESEGSEGSERSERSARSEGSEKSERRKSKFKEELDDVHGEVSTRFYPEVN